ncbi:hypothetical protein [Streptomyces sp. NPDC002566]|uniref:hypothetical protein n=1 Tax=Streptomyces sp. NPDC002566 TaxID=3364650 RepID=UPI0036B7A020
MSYRPGLAMRRAGRSAGVAVVLLAVLSACGPGFEEPTSTTSISPDQAGTPSVNLLRKYGVSLPGEATSVHYREVVPRSGGTLYVRMRLPDEAARGWMTDLGGSASDLTKGWSPVSSHELRESGWHIEKSDEVFGAMIPIPESGPETSKDVLIVEDTSETAWVYLVANL